MSERQTSSDGVIAGPETDPAGSGGKGGDGAQNPEPAPTTTNGAEPVAEQVAEQVAAEPPAADPGPAAPGDGPPTGEQVVVTGDEARELASAAPDGPAPDGPASDGPAPDGTASDGPASDGPAPDGTAPDGTAAASAASPAPPSPRPRPTPRPAEPAPHSDNSPTVPAAAPVGAAARGGSEAPTVVQSAHPWFNSADAVATQVLPRTPAEPTTELIPIVAAAPPPSSPPAGLEEPRPRNRRLLVGAGVLALLALLYVGDLALNSGSVPRGVTVAGVQVGGLETGEAEQRLRSAIEPRSAQPVAVTVGEARSEIDPTAAGLTIDWSGTLAQAGSQPLNPITRITSFFTEREVGVVTTTDGVKLDAALQELAPIVDRAPVEGSVRFDGSTPMPVEPVAGQQLDVPGAAAVLEREWASGATVVLPLVELPATTTSEDVAAAIAEVARPAVAAPVTVIGEVGTRATLSPDVIASALSFRADAGALVPEINQSAIVEELEPQLARSERPNRDAELDFSTPTPTVIPSQDGRGVDYDATLKDLLDVLTGTGPREITAVYADKPAELTTEELKALGITGVIGEFQTGGFASDSGQNIKRAAEQINGTVVQPGETFSLNALTNPRNAANGYVEAGVISDGHPSRGVGGGVSQVATTVYNAAYFAGMVDVEHREHSFYISRYPAGREATVFENVIDLKFRNDNPTGIMIQTAWTPSSLTVRIYGTKRYEVTSTTGARTNPTPPNTVVIPPGEPCSPSQGAPGFTVTDTRTLREISTGKVRNETRTVRYNPSPIVVCGP